MARKTAQTARVEFTDEDLKGIKAYDPEKDGFAPRASTASTRFGPIFEKMKTDIKKKGDGIVVPCPAHLEIDNFHQRVTAAIARRVALETLAVIKGTKWMVRKTDKGGLAIIANPIEA